MPRRARSRRRLWPERRAGRSRWRFVRLRGAERTAKHRGAPSGTIQNQAVRDGANFSGANFIHSIRYIRAKKKPPR